MIKVQLNKFYVKQIVKPPKNDQKISKTKANYEKVMTYRLGTDETQSNIIAQKLNLSTWQSTQLQW